MLRRSALTLAARSALNTTARRTFTTSFIRHDEKHDSGHGAPASVPAHSGKRNMDKKFEEIKEEHDLMPEGAAPGTVPTDAEQSTGLERLEILGKMQGIDIFDMRPLQSDRLGTLNDPIVVKSAGEEQYCGCTGCPADSHNVKWLTLSRDRPLGRCPECGSCYLMEYIGAHHVHEAHREVPVVKSFADFLKPEYYYR